MRTSTAVTGAAAGLVLAFGIAGTAGAAAPAQASPTNAAGSPAAVFVSSPTAAPGQTIHVDGTCALPASGPMPKVISVTSPAFTGPENFSKTDPDAFDGTATIRSDAAPGSYTVTLTCSNGSATTDLQVVAAHGGGTGGNTGGNSGSGANSGTLAPAAPVAPSNQPAAQPESGSHSDSDSLAVGLTIVAVVAAGAAGYVVVTRRRSSGKHREHAGV